MLKGDAFGQMFLIYVVAWTIYFVAFYLEWKSYQRRIDRFEEINENGNGPKCTLLYTNLSTMTILTIILPCLLSAILIFPIMTFYPDNVSSSQFESTLAVLAIFLGFGIAIGAGFLFYAFYGVREASEEGIGIVRLRRHAPVISSSIRWTEVTGVDISIFLDRPMIIYGARKRIAVSEYLENLQPLFEFMRRKVPRAVFTDMAFDYIAPPSQGIIYASKEEWTQDRSTSLRANPCMAEAIRMSYSKAFKAFSIIVSTVVLILMLVAGLFDFALANLFSVWSLLVLFLTLLPVLLIMEVYLSFYTLSSEGIEHHSMYRGRIFIPWNEVESIAYEVSNGGSIFRIKGNERKIVLVCMVDCLPEFARMVANKVPLERWTMARLEISRLLREKASY